MIKSVYPNRDIQTQRERKQAPIIHTNIFTYTHTLMNFYEANPAPTDLSNKRLKIRLNDNTMSSKRNSTYEDTVPIHFLPHQNNSTFIEINNPTPTKSAVATK